MSRVFVELSEAQALELLKELRAKKVAPKYISKIEVAYVTRADYLHDIWTIDDVREYAVSIGKRRPSKNRAREILAQLHHYYDAAIGISWNVLDTYL